MPYAVAILVGLSVTLLSLALYELVTAPRRAVIRELEEMRSLEPTPFVLSSRRRRQARSEKLREAIRKLGEKVERGGVDLEGWSKRLIQAGYWSADAPRIFLGMRVVAAAMLTSVGLLGAALMDARLLATLVLGLWLGVLGWVVPGLWILRRKTARQKEIRKSLPDVLDLMVACVEAGMGLNQALNRVAEEIRHVSEALSEELSMVNLEIRAGTPRREALWNLAERVDVDGVEALVSALVQTERFGTSVGKALRTQAETLRQKRRQQAEETAAKTTIKLVFPLVLFVFPALFVVILGPAVIQILQALGEM